MSRSAAWVRSDDPIAPELLAEADRRELHRWLGHVEVQLASTAPTPALATRYEALLEELRRRRASRAPHPPEATCR